ncbi:MAG: OmpH family outer membrane protein, partial [Bacteroidota bacterium]
GPVKDKIIDAIKEIAKEEGFHFVLDKNDQFLIVLYGDERFDLTFRVLDRLKRGSTGSMK